MSATEVPQVVAAADESGVRPIPVDLEPTGPELVIRQRTGWIPVDWRELWRHRELLYFLCWRDVKVRYKQAVLGFAWAIFAPLISVVIFTLIFGSGAGFANNADMPEGVHYSVFVFAGLIPWLMIAAAIATGGMSLVSQQNLLSKIYMPRLFIPTAVIGSSFVDMLISSVVFLGMMAVYRVSPAWTIIFVPFLVLLTMIAAMGFSYALSALTVSYRDLRFLIPFIVQVLMLISAVAYPSSVLRNHSWLLYINPVAGLIGAYRAAIFHDYTLNVWHFIGSVAMILALFAFGLFYFRKTERRFADIA